jgi:hypothetical protein
VDLADLFCRLARARIHASFNLLEENEDRRTYRIAQQTLGGRFEWLEGGIL